MKSKKVRNIKVISQNGRNYKPTPTIILKGQWLNEIGIVEVDGDKTHTIYLKKPFRETLGFAVTSINYDIDDLVKQGEIIYES